MKWDLLKIHLSNPIEKDEDFVRGALRLMEGLHREMALLALADWRKLEVFVPELYQPLSALTQPSWGVWNRIIQELRKARKKILYRADKEQRDQFERLGLLNSILEILVQRVPAEETDQLKPLADFFNLPTKRLTLSAPLEWGIRLRNRIAHDLPDDPAWWAEAAGVLKPLLPWLAEQNWLPDDVSYPPPWFYEDQGRIHHFNGLEGKKAVRYLPVGEGAPLVKEELLTEFSLALTSLLGEKEKQEKNVKRLLEELTPEEIKGILLGDFLVGAPIGEGAFARVHKAIHLSTGARVAVKILKDASDEEMRDRFRQEAELLARMNHDNILIVYDYGESTWRLPRNVSLKNEAWFREFKNTNQKHYIAMEWIDGLSLDQIYHLQKIDPEASLDEALKNTQTLGALLDGWKAHVSQRGSSPMPEWESVLKEEIRILPRSKEPVNQEWLSTWFREAALALQYIHDQGLVHRDLKPSNLMITRDGRLKVMDFGIARNLAEGKTMMTVTGAALGTPAYMSPEQIRAQSASLEIGPSSDIYSLSATFYELYTRSRCYDHDVTDHFTIQSRKLQGILPERPRERNRSLSWELNTLLLGGMEQEPADRFQNMRDLADDLLRFQMDEAIQYRRPSLLRRVQLTYRRNTVLINTVVTFLAILVIGASVSFYNVNQQRNIAEQERTEAIRQKTIVEKKEEEARLILATMYAREGDNARTQHSWSDALLYYGKSLEQAENHIVRIGAANTFSYLTPELGSFWQMKPANSLSFSPDGKTLASAAWDDDTVKLWDMFSGRMVQSLKGNSAPVTSISYSPNGRILAVVYGEQTIRLWDVVRGQKIKVLKANDMIISVAFSPDGKILAYGAEDKSIRLWDVYNSKISKVLRVNDSLVVSASFSPDGKTLASGTVLGAIHIWDLVRGQKIKVLKGHSYPIERLVFSPDGSRLISSSIVDSNALIVWEWSRSRTLELIRKEGEGDTQFAAFSQDGKIAVSLSMDNSIRLWDVNSGKEPLALLRHDFGFFAAAISPDGKMLAVSTNNGFRLWDVSAFNQSQSSMLAPNSRTSESSVGNEVPKILRGHTATVSQVTFSRDGNILATSSYGTIRLWRLSDGAQIGVLEGHVGGVLSLTFTADGGILKSVGVDGRVRLWDVNNRKNLMLLKEQKVAFNSFPLSPDGNSLASLSADNVIHLWDVNKRKERRQMKGQSDVTSPLLFSPDNKILVSSSDEHAVLLWDVATGNQLARLQGHTDQIRSVCFSSDGKNLASASTDATIRLWDVQRKTKKKVFEGHTEAVRGISFSPDGKILVSHAFDKTVRFWDVKKGKEIFQYTNGLAIRHIALSNDGKTLAVASFDNNIDLLSVEDGSLITRLYGHDSWINSLSFSPDDRTLASASHDKTVRLWPLGTTEFTRLRNRSRNYSKLGLSYKLELDGQLLSRDAEKLAQARLEAARNGGIPWLTNGGRGHVEFYASQLEQIRIVKQAKKLLLKEHKEAKQDFTPEQLLWLAKYLPAATLADGIIVEEEKRLLKYHADLFVLDVRAMEVYRNTLLTKDGLRIDAIGYDVAFAQNSLNKIVNICWSDLELHTTEIDYINQIATALSLDKSLRNEVVTGAISSRYRMRKSLMTILDELDRTEKHWLAFLIFNVIQADGVTTNHEEGYIDTVQNLLFDEAKALEFIKKSRIVSIENLPRVELSADLLVKILRFLAGITISYSGIDEQGLSSVKSMAKRSKVKSVQAANVISSTKALEIYFE